MRETRVLIVTLMHHRFGPAMLSWERAIQHAERSLPGARFDHLRLYGNPLHVDDGHSIVTAKYREAQQAFLAGEWWAFVSIEDDMILPRDALVRLVGLLGGGADIGYGLYVWRHGSAQWSAYTKLTARNGYSLSKEPSRAREAWGKVVDVAGVGMGCTAIARPVLEEMSFQRRGEPCNDWYLALDAQKHGYVQRCDLGLVCGHMTMEPSPRVLWPDPEGNANGLYRVELLDGCEQSP